MASGHLNGVISYLRRTFGAPEAGEKTDRQLLRSFAEDRDEAAFAELVRRHAAMVLAVCRRVLRDGPDADDAFQATFLVLARKAAAGGWHDSVGSWLHEVAYRSAMKARVDAARRRVHESRVPDMPSIEPHVDASHQELRAVLDEELRRLPEKYRAPLVLCYLEGKTNDEAAQQLGWTKGTVSGRLARARDLLRGRLSRRNFALSAGLFAAALSQEAAPAAVPAALLDSTIKAALLAPAAQAAAVGVPAAALAEGVLQTMHATKVKLAFVFLLTLGLIGSGAGIVGYRLATGDAAVVAKVVPGPETGVKPEGPKASEPAIKDGLSVTVLPERTVFAVDQPLAFKLTFKNVSKETFLLFDAAWTYDYGVRFFGVPAGGPWSATSVRNVDRPPPDVSDSKALAPGASLDVKLLLDAGYRYAHELKDSAPAAHLAKGRYRVVVTRKFVKSPAEALWKHNHWTGDVTTQPVEFAIGDQASPLQEKLPAALEQLAAGKGDLTQLTVTYDNTHPLWGGLRLTIKGNGKIEQTVKRAKAGEPRDVPAAELARLAALLVKHRAWDQRTADRVRVPDESEARLIITVGDQTVRIWEFANEMAKNKRLEEIRDLMMKIAWKE
jgi:RNA polymerase sigma factor (sigma-70 family)